MDRYFVLTSGYCSGNFFGSPRYITGIFSSFFQEDHYKLDNITVESFGEAISVICERLNCNLVSVTYGKNANGDMGYFYFFERNQKF